MPIFGGPIDGLLIAGMLVAGVVAWAVRRRQYSGPKSEHEVIDREALDEAEREMREWDRSRDHEDDEDESKDDDWGPGTARRPRLG